MDRSPNAGPAPLDHRTHSLLAVADFIAATSESHSPAGDGEPCRSRRILPCLCPDLRLPRSHRGQGVRQWPSGVMVER